MKKGFITFFLWDFVEKAAEAVRRGDRIGLNAYHLPVRFFATAAIRSKA